jgi:hypothetical protein
VIEAEVIAHAQVNPVQTVVVPSHIVRTLAAAKVLLTDMSTCTTYFRIFSVSDPIRPVSSGTCHVRSTLYSELETAAENDLGTVGKFTGCSLTEDSKPFSPAEFAA